MIQLKNPVTETQTFSVRKITRTTHITYIIEESLTLLWSSIDEETDLEIAWTTLMKLKRIEGVKIELRKAIVLTDASDKSCDNNTHFEVQSEISKATRAYFYLVFYTYKKCCIQIFPVHNWYFLNQFNDLQFLR